MKYQVLINAKAFDGKTSVLSEKISINLKFEKEITAKELIAEAIKHLRYDYTYLEIFKEEVYVNNSSHSNRNSLDLSKKIKNDVEFAYYVELKPKAK